MSARAGTHQARAFRSACRKLVRQYPVRNWWPARSRFEVMVGAVLVHNTRWANVAGAIEALRAEKCLSPRAVRSLPEKRLQGLVRPAGCQSIKTRRLRALAHAVSEAGGLRVMARMNTARLREELLAVHGVGAETADAILCFAFERPVFIADQYARRWLERMGYISAGTAKNYATTAQCVDSWLEGGVVDQQNLHAGIVLHGQAVCGRSPRCPDCILRSECEYLYKT